MSYKQWFDAHASKHRHIVAKLTSQGYNQSQIIEYFCWENFKEAEPDFCPLFADNQKCHDMPKLNCYLCACPHFRFDDDAMPRKSSCCIDARQSKSITYQGVTHLDCSHCTLPHHKSFIQKYFSPEWSTIMKDVQTGQK